VAAVSLTGSVATGRVAAALCAEAPKPLQAELGGNNAAIVWRDADLARAAERVAAGAFEQAGQRCTANRRVVVDARCADAFLEELAKATAALVVGDPFDPATHVGPLVSAEARACVEAALAEARAAGCAIVTPHGDVPDACVAPSIVACDDPGHPIVQEELFGPVLVVQRADGFEHALALLNGVRQGLAAALFSPSEARRARFLAAAEAGILKLDESTSGAGVEAPFGGWKASGTGPPEHGPGNREFYTRWQAVYGDG
jgi:acyl-CoA reductase-like NAD-dependent aldehyde dehydrogenase